MVQNPPRADSIKENLPEMVVHLLFVAASSGLDRPVEMEVITRDLLAFADVRRCSCHVPSTDTKNYTLKTGFKQESLLR